MKPALLGALFGALLLLVYIAPVGAAGLHPDCNVTMPCVAPVASGLSKRHSRAERFRNVEFGAPLAPGETQRSFLGRSSGLVAPLAAKIASIQSACPGTSVISGVRHTRIAGTRQMSLHSQGKAADVTGPYGCIYGQLRGWQGGCSTDAGRMRHIHISFDADGGREMGLAFRHGGHRHRHKRYATAQ